MDTSQIVNLVKSSIGIKHTLRDEYLTAIVEGVINELETEKGLVLDGANPYHLMFCVDYAEFRYKKPKEGAMPRDLQYRLHNLILKSGGASDV